MVLFVGPRSLRLFIFLLFLFFEFFYIIIFSIFLLFKYFVNSVLFYIQAPSPPFCMQCEVLALATRSCCVKVGNDLEIMMIHNTVYTDIWVLICIVSDKWSVWMKNYSCLSNQMSEHYLKWATHVKNAIKMLSETFMTNVCDCELGVIADC